jgi:hypothetical protein
MQDSKIVAVTRKRVDHPELRLLLGRQHRAGVDTLSSGPKHPPPATKNRTQRALWYGGDFANTLKLIVIQPGADVGVKLGQYFERLRGEKLSLISSRHVLERFSPVQPGCPPACPDCRLADQFVDGNANRERQPESLACLVPDTGSHVLRRAEEPASSGQVEKGVTISSGLDRRRESFQDLMQRT